MAQPQSKTVATNKHKDDFSASKIYLTRFVKKKRVRKNLCSSRKCTVLR